ELLERPEAQMALELGEGVDAPCEHRERGFYRLDEAREVERKFAAPANRVGERGKTRSGFRRDRRIRLAGIELVLRGEHYAGVIAGKPQFFGHDRRNQRAEVFVVAEDAVDPLAPKACDGVVDEAKRIEPAELQVLREA